MVQEEKKLQICGNTNFAVTPMFVIFCVCENHDCKPWYPNMKIEGHLEPKSYMQNFLPTLIKHFSFPVFVQKYWEIKKVHESQKVTGNGNN